jgi:hypothetical protein
MGVGIAHRGFLSRSALTALKIDVFTAISTARIVTDTTASP